jgi:hypothetical protein
VDSQPGAFSQSHTSFSRVAWFILERGRRTSTFQFSIPLFRGVAEAALYCAHRATVIHLNAPSKLACYPFRDGGLIDLLLRASNEGLLRPRVARAQTIIRLHPLLCSASKKGTWPLLPHPSSR